MKALKIIFMAYGCFFLTMAIAGQENPTTPEYEATRQTEKLQQELNLSPEQVKLVYEINLKYARARQNSTSRADAMQRVKSKDADLERVLTTDQINKLQTKRYEKSVYQPLPQNNFRPTETTPRTGQPSQRTSGTQMRTTESVRSQDAVRRTNDQQRSTPSTGSGERQTNTRRNYPATNYPTGRRETSTGTR